MSNVHDELNAMNAKMLLDSMTEKPPSRERLFKPLTIIEDNPDHVDRPELDSQILSLITGEVWIGGTVWQPENLMDLVKRDYGRWIK